MGSSSVPPQRIAPSFTSISFSSPKSKLDTTSRPPAGVDAGRSFAKRWNAEAAAINSAGVQIPRGADPHLASGTCFGLELPDCGLALIAAQLLFEGFVGFTEAGVPWNLLGASREI
jgi:hypothetical protein